MKPTLTLLWVLLFAPLAALHSAGEPAPITVSPAAGLGAERLPLSQRTVYSGDYPRAVFFRYMERVAQPYEEWEKSVDGLSGFIGQALPDQLSDHIEGILPKVAEYYRRFKERHPEQIVLLHVNGLSQVPTIRTMHDFPGHWLYFEGTRISETVPASQIQTTLKVANTELFTLKAGFQRDRPDHLGICALDAAGKPDWRKAEYAQLVAIDPAGGTITVKRAMFGSQPMALPAGRGYVAALVTHGPWNRERGELEWHYNFSTECPRDEQGRNAGDMFVEYLARAFGKGGPLENADGVAFDVMYLTPQILGGQWRFRQPDFNGDGRGEDFHKDTTYMAGENEFYRKLRQALGKDYLLTSDVQELDNQRALGILNGGESENWLTHNDPLTKHWSSGINRNFFWEGRARPPTFNYLNHKFSPPTRPSRMSGKLPFQVIPFNQHRLKMAAAVLSGAVVTSNRPATDPVGIWDELVQGKDRKAGWLGKAVGPTVRLVSRAQPLLPGEWTKPEGLIPHLKSANAHFTRDGDAVCITPLAAGEGRFEIQGVPLQGPDLTILATVRAAPRKGFPAEYARILLASAGVKGLPIPDLDRNQLKEDNREFALVDGKPFVAVFYFRNLKGNSVDVELCLESNEPMWLESLAAYAAPDAMYREFERGVVIANPGVSLFTFKLAELLPGRSYRRILGTELQDPVANNGKLVGGSVDLPALDALFLVREKLP